jgi:4-hydroxy-tetrahydrodipicolinate synthase
VRAPRLALEGAEHKRIASIIEKALKKRPVLPEYLNL